MRGFLTATAAAGALALGIGGSALAQGGGGAPGCTYAPGNGSLTVTNANSEANLFVEATETGAIEVSEHTFPPNADEVITPVPCSGGSGPSVTTVDSIDVTSEATLVLVGEFGPGAETEQGAAEIEVRFDGPSLSLQPPEGDTRMVFGRNPASGEIGANLNAAAETSANDDSDLTLVDPSAVLVLAGGGRNVITGAGAGSLSRPFPGTLSGYGGGGRDEFEPGSGPVSFYSAGGGEDVLRGGDGADRLLGGSGRDQIAGRAGADELDGERENDRVRGGGDDDKVVGSYDADRLTGGGGRDRLLGGVGDDLLLAGDGRRDRRIDCQGGSDKHERARVDRSDPRPRSC